ncbi:DNA polymerase III subunit chi [Pseudaminobacter arsenicus]|uniref:DNA polymerase III subunit chi n=1 Tax=Borborobacter arsenicus TaxID=1851146 RepID=A0A432V2K6_9HYPH|nr:DNA polymerase III subunit chi [Pseudaminobacter arsenicus]RUM96444.1 DNA polymerase III subunit chi [Pseudaminobacter arsenicus]
MTDVLFYHLTESTLEDALPGLLERSVQRGWRVVVQAGSDERRDALDAHLWTFRDDSFLAHGPDGEPHAAEQPILLTTSIENRNEAQVRFLVDGANPPDLGPYERAVFMFDGHDAAQLEAAREHWKVTKAAGHTVTYWQQTSDRRWERKA